MSKKSLKYARFGLNISVHASEMQEIESRLFQNMMNKLGHIGAISQAFIYKLMNGPYLPIIDYSADAFIFLLIN